MKVIQLVAILALFAGCKKKDQKWACDCVQGKFYDAQGNPYYDCVVDPTTGKYIMTDCKKVK